MIPVWYFGASTTWVSAGSTTQCKETYRKR
jgi:hypothetical protein